ncbi:MAG: proline--tRNA ligase [Elusimicrobiota bacterium]
MRFSKTLIPTLKEVPKDAEIVSHKLMYRAGMIRKLSAGIYEWLPIGFRVLKKVENIIREEMDNAGALEVFLPALQPKDLWMKSGRWDVYGKELMRLKDRHEREFCLGPTHEEVITNRVGAEVKSYRNLPITLYQFQTKFRDEIRPRFGIMRSREFYMKDAYSFDTTDENAQKSYEIMVEAYKKMFKRCGLEFGVVEADSGAIGGSFSHEFMVFAESGESKIVSCACGYAANLEKASADFKIYDDNNNEKNYEKVKTPNVTSVEEVSKFLQIPAHKFLKALVYKTNNEYIMVLIRGDRQINEHKLSGYLKVNELIKPEEKEIIEKLGLVPGFLGPLKLQKNLRIIADASVTTITGAVAGANEKDYHCINVNFKRDINCGEIADVILVNEDDRCSKCGMQLHFSQGIEVGHTFKLGTKYSDAMQAEYLDENGETKSMIMGCYGIGVSRVVAAAIEQNHDANGIIWPWAIAPYQIGVVITDTSNNSLMEIGEKIYNTLKAEGFDALLDDRDERAGVKFKDMDLIGIPLRIIIGKKYLENKEFELKPRKQGESTGCKEEKLLDVINELRKLL